MKNTNISYKNQFQYVDMNQCDIFTDPKSKELFCSEMCFACGAACQFAKYLTLHTDEKRAVETRRATPNGSNKTLYSGTKKKLDFAINKLRRIIADYCGRNINNIRFTPNMDAVEKLDDELNILDELVYADRPVKSNEWVIVRKYLTIADELKAA